MSFMLLMNLFLTNNNILQLLFDITSVKYSLCFFSTLKVPKSLTATYMPVVESLGVTVFVVRQEIEFINMETKVL